MEKSIPLVEVVDHGDRSFDESFVGVAKDEEWISSLVYWIVGFDSNDSSIGWCVE